MLYVLYLWVNALSLFYKIPDLIMVADQKKSDFIGELKQNAVFKTRTDFPIVGVPVFQAKTMGEGRVPIKVPDSPSK